MPRERARGRAKKKGPLNIIKWIGGALIALLLLFLLVDQFTLYWFVLLNQDENLERRQQDGQTWYDDYGNAVIGEPDSTGNNYGGQYGNQEVFTGNFENMSPEEAVKIVSKTLTEEEKYDFESAMRIFIYIMDRKGFVPNATIGAMSNMMAEAGTMGLYAYESHYIKSNPGPDGNLNSRYLGNQEWVEWLNGPGREWARDRSSSYQGKATYSIGLGLIQSTDTWSRETGEKKNANATRLLESAIEAGMYWQEPGFQILYYMDKYFTSEEPFGRSAWDTIQSPGVDPTTDSDVTAYEWAARVYCGVEYPGLVYTEAINYTSGDYHDQIITHTDGIAAAEELYHKYSKKDPWFYSKTTKYNYTGPNDWHNPFTGPAYDNTNDIGTVIARMGVLFAALDRTRESQILFDQHGEDSPNLADPRLNYYRCANTASGQTWYYASCDRAASLAVLMAGADDDFPRAVVGPQEDHMKSSDKWKYIGTVKDSQMQPGDIMITDAHIQMYVGTNIAGERWPGTTSRVFQASLEQYFPDMDSGLTNSARVYRCIDPDWSPKYWDAFIAYIGNEYPELPRQYMWQGASSDSNQLEQEKAAPWSTGWYWPLPGVSRITSRIGNRNNPFTKAGSEEHHGTDIGAADGTKIYAAKSGTVVEAVWQPNNMKERGPGSRGSYYTIESDDGVTCVLYQHMSANYDLMLKVGDHVTAGQHIGYVGNSGRSTGPHLHIEITTQPYNYSKNVFYGVEHVFPEMEFTY